jgi:hypothetical protein
MFLNAYQNAYVTRNRDKAVATLRERHGMGEFIFFEPDIEVRTPGGIGRAQTRVALGWAGNLQIEIIEPVSGLVDLYYPYLPDDDSLRFHHSAIRVDDWKPFCEEIARKKYPVAYASGLEGLEFVYLDARDTLGHYVEYMWATPEWWKTLGYPGA